MVSKGKGVADTFAFYQELTKLQSNQDYEKCLKLCNKILGIDGQDTTAFHCKIVSLMQLGKFGDALRQIRTTHLAEKIDVKFEEAYCLYRNNQLEDALKALDGSNAAKNSVKHSELRAQILYRLEKFEECLSVYSSIVKNSMGDDFEVERMTNMAAVVVNLNANGIERSLPDKSDETYEMAYNRACYLLATGQPEEAEKLLIKAEKMCVDYLKEDQEEDNQQDIDQETGIIKVQRGYAIQVQNKGEREREVQSIYNAVLKKKPSDIGLIAVASNNLLTINRDQNIFDSKKRIKAATVDGLEHKLTSRHQSAISRNNALLAMYTNQVSVCKDLVGDLVKKSVIEKEDGDLILAGVFSRSGRTKDAVELVLESGKKASDVERCLIACQILLEKGEVKEALKTLESLPNDVKCRAGILSAIVSLALALGDKTKAANSLKDAVKAKKGSKQTMAIIWRKTAEFHLKGDEPNVAAQSLEELSKLEPNNIQTLSQLVLAYAKYDLSKALLVSKKLPKFQGSGDLDVEKLEESSFLGSRYGKKIGKPGDPTSPKVASPKKDDEELVAKKKKRKQKRKKKLPKNYNPNIDPDPERWLPRRERTGYRKTRKERRKGEKFTGAQGNAAGQSEVFDYSQKKATSVSSPQAKKTATPEQPVGPRQQRNKPQHKKKKNKNRF